MAQNLIELAERFVRQSRELDETRAAMKRLLLNGAGDHPVRPPPAGRPGRTGSQPQPQPQPQEPQPNHLELAKQAESQTLAMLKERPHRMAEISSEMKARQSTTSERLRRLREKGLVTQANGAWEAVSAASA